MMEILFLLMVIGFIVFVFACLIIGNGDDK